MLPMKLLDYVADMDISMREAARRVGIPLSTMTAYARGERIPRQQHMLRLWMWSAGAVGPDDFYDLPVVRAS